MKNPIVVALVVTVPLLMLSGCGLSKSDMAGPGPVVGPALGGHVHGGQQPVSLSRVYMFQANTNGYGQKASSKLIHTQITANPAGGGEDSKGTYVYTDTSGDFTITGAYVCKPGLPVYLLALGGNPGVGTGVDNDKLALMAVLGPCPTDQVFPSSDEVIINEATTVAAAYALSGFLTGPTGLSIPSGDTLAMTGLLNATANAGQLVDISTGLARTVTQGGNGIVPQREIYTLANILAACVNTDGTNTDDDASPTGCYSVLHGVDGYSAPDTISLMLHVAGSPGPATVANLILLSTKTSPFQPSLTSTPNDFTVAIGFSGGGLYQPGIPAVDAAGNVWFPTPFGTLSGLSPVGVALTPDEGQSLFLVEPTQAAVDPEGNIWVSDAFDDDIAETTYSPPNLTTFTYSVVRTESSEGDDVHQIAIDSTGYVYVSDYTVGTIYKLDNNGLPASGYVPSTMTGLEGVALLSDTRFYAGYSPSSGQEFTSDGLLVGSPTSCASFMDSSCGLSSPSAFAVDSNGVVWATNSNSTLAYFIPTASTVTTVSGGGLSFGNPAKVNWLAIDGGDHIWVPNYDGASVSEFDDGGVALSPDTTGFQGPLHCSASGLAIDGSGDVWVSCQGGESPVVEFIGAAVPVYTPLTPGHFGVMP